MLNKKISVLLLALCLGCAATAVFAQQSQQPLTNADVVKMVKSGLPASVISNAIQANETDFDVSANGLIALQKAGVPQTVMDAMISASSKKRSAAAASTAAPAVAAPSAALPNGGQLAVTVAQGGKSVALPLEKTQLAQTKSKASSMGALATDSAVNQAFQVGVNEAAWQAWSHGGGYGTYSGVTAGASVMSGIMGHRKPTVTYVWALPGPSAGNALENSPSFDVTFTGIPGINEEEYEPAIVKLTATSNNWRLVGASQGKADTMQDSSANWEVYSSYVEEKVAVRANKLGSGHVQISPASPLAAGQYGVVLRPRSKSKRFSGADVANNHGEGLIFNSVFSFAVK
ncbi:MAG TPA: hypothetical protein VJN48_05910 [Terriglobales bacterium]|nr:hypothetical protein [Terriglobales bacterium]